jgi:hypothetical protein
VCHVVTIFSATARAVSGVHRFTGLVDRFLSSICPKNSRW